MFIVALNGSPQMNGNTATLLQAALEEVRVRGADTELVHIGEVLKELKTPFCSLCANPCEGRCSQANRLGETFDLLRRANGVLVGSPVYFGTVSGQLKSFWDKTRILRKEKALLGIPGGALTAGAGRYGGQENVLNVIHHMMLVQGMTVVGDGFQEDDCGHFGVCAQSPVSGDPESLKRARVLARRVAEVAAKTTNLREKKHP